MSTETITLPPTETTFNVSIKGNETNQIFDGTFSYKRPTLGMRSEIAKIVTFLNGDQQNPSVEAEYLNTMLAKLQVCLVKYPEWWAKSNLGREIYDLNVLEEIFMKTVEFEKEWHKKIWGESKETEKSK